MISMNMITSMMMPTIMSMSIEALHAADEAAFESVVALCEQVNIYKGFPW
jgi:hypothetical protein